MTEQTTTTTDTTDTTTTPDDGPRIYVASLSDYNAGRLFGAWIDATQDADDIAGDIARMLADSPGATICQRCGIGTKNHQYPTSDDGPLTPDAHRPILTPAEEYAIHDHDGFHGIRIDEHDDLRTVSIIGQGIAEHGPAFAAYVDNIGARYVDDDTADAFTEAFAGEYETFREYSDDLVDELIFAGSDIPADHPARTYFDYDAWARDLILGGDYWTSDAPGYGVYVFRSI